jgi:hypothetical protein
MIFIDFLKFSATWSSTGVLAVGAAATGCRAVAQAITDGDISLTSTGLVLVVDDGVGGRELGLYNVTDSTHLTRTQVLRNGTGGTSPVAFANGATLTVYSDVPASFLNGVSLGQLGAAAALSATDVIPIGQSGTEVQTTLDAFYTYVANRLTAEGKIGTTVETLTITALATQVAGTAFSFSGTYANVTPTALDYSINGGSTWNAATATISGGTFTVTGVTIPNATTSQTVMVRDRTNTSVTATSASFIVNPNTVLTVNTPSAQTVGTAFTLSGTYTGTAPASLDYQKEDGTWVQASSPTIGSGAYSFSVTPTTATASRTISVRDHTYTGISATSGSYAVNAAAGSTVTGVTVTAASSTISGGATDQMSATVTGTNSPSQAVTWSIDSGGGSINSSGLYTAPAATGSAQTITLRATSTQDNTKYGTVTITVAAAASPGPSLTTLKAWATGQTTAVATVTTDTSTGTIYWLYSTSATATAAQVKAGSSAAVTSSGSKTLQGTGLTAGTAYYVHVLHTNGAGTDSAVLDLAAAITTQPASGQPTVTVYGTALKSSLTASDAYGTSGSNKLYTGSNTGGNIWVFHGSTPSTASTGWSQSNTVPPAVSSDRSTNGMYPMSIAAAESGSTNNTYLYAPIGSTTTWYFWMEINGIYTVMNSSGTVVTL